MRERERERESTHAKKLTLIGFSRIEMLKMCYKRCLQKKSFK